MVYVQHLHMQCYYSDTEQLPRRLNGAIMVVCVMRRPSLYCVLIGWFYPMVKQSSELSVWRHTLAAIKAAELRHKVEEGRVCVCEDCPDGVFLP